MGQQLMKALSFKKEKRILMLGFGQGGQTTILYQIKLKQKVDSVPTIGFNVETVQYKNLTFTFWDVHGRGPMYCLWPHYYEGTNALIYVIDSYQVDDLEQSIDRLQFILSNEKMFGIPVLIFANKQDIAQISIRQLFERLEIHQFKKVTRLHIQGCCGITGEGVNEGLEWLYQTLNNQN